MLEANNNLTWRDVKHILASTSDAIVIGFNVRPMGNARTLSEKEKILSRRLRYN